MLVEGCAIIVAQKETLPWKKSIIRDRSRSIGELWYLFGAIEEPAED